MNIFDHQTRKYAEKEYSSDPGNICNFNPDCRTGNNYKGIMETAGSDSSLQIQGAFNAGSGISSWTYDCF